MRNRYYKTLLGLAPLVWCLWFTSLKAQQLDVQEWSNGQVILATGDTLYGSITYHHNEEIIRVILEDGSNQAFTPVGVRSFAVTDDRGGYHQVFRSFFWNHGNEYSDYQAPAFFEVLQEGPFTLVKREVVSFRNQNVTPLYAGYGRYYDPYGNGYYPGSRSQAVVLDLLFLYTPKQKIVTLKNPKRDLEDLFGDKSDEMKQYIKSKHLSYNQTPDVIRIIQHFNSL